MAATSLLFPVTEADAPVRSGWLRTALLAAIPATVAALAVELLLGEQVLDRAVTLESAHVTAVLDAPFTRNEQRVGMLLGKLLYATGIAAVLAGALVAVPSRRPARSRWAIASLAGAWGAVIVPFAAYPPLPPGVDSGLDIAARQWLFMAYVALGVIGVLLAASVAERWDGPRRWIAAAAALAAPIVVAVLVVPQQRAGPASAGELVRDFRLTSLAAQLAFWLTLAVVGMLLLCRRRKVAMGAP